MTITGRSITHASTKNGMKLRFVTRSAVPRTARTLNGYLGGGAGGAAAFASFPPGAVARGPAWARSSISMIRAIFWFAYGRSIVSQIDGARVSRARLAMDPVDPRLHRDRAGLADLAVARARPDPAPA